MIGSTATAEHTERKVLPLQRGCVQQSWSAPGRVESRPEPTDLPPWTSLPCTPPWASLQTGSSGGKVPFLVSPSPGGKTDRHEHKSPGKSSLSSSS